MASKDQINFEIRPYSPEYRTGILQIAADTAFFGDPVEAYLDDRKLFCDSFYRYYTDIESQNSWVAHIDGRVLGFIVGSVNTKVQQTVWKRKIIPSTILQLLSGNYRIGTKTMRYVAGVLRSAIKQEFTNCRLDIYPSHLHINVDVHARGYGIGHHLMTA